MQEQKVLASDQWLEMWCFGNPEGQSVADVRLHWRPTAQAVQRLAEGGAIEARLLVVVEYEGREVQRHLFPLEWGKNYVSFSYIGKNSIHATIVWSDDPQDRTAERLLYKWHRDSSYIRELLANERPTVVALDEQMSEVHSQLDTLDLTDEEESRLRDELHRLSEEKSEHYHYPFEAVIRRDLFDYVYNHGKSYQLGRVKLTVDVPAEMFGNKDSWPITRYVGGFFFEKEARDNCQLRRRAILTALLSPLWIPLGLLLMTVIYGFKFVGGALVIGVLHLWGMRNIKYRTFSLDTDYWPNNAWSDVQPSRWWTRQERIASENPYYVEYEYRLRHPIFLVLNPPMFVLVSGVVWLLLAIDAPEVTVALPVMVVLGVIASLVVSVAMASYREEEMPVEQRREITQQEVQERFGAVESGQPNAPVLRLWFRELKAEVCRPFARNA